MGWGGPGAKQGDGSGANSERRLRSQPVVRSLPVAADRDSDHGVLGQHHPQGAQHARGPRRTVGAVPGGLPAVRNVGDHHAGTAAIQRPAKLVGIEHTGSVHGMRNIALPGRQSAREPPGRRGVGRLVEAFGVRVQIGGPGDQAFPARQGQVLFGQMQRGGSMSVPSTVVIWRGCSNASTVSR